VTADLWGNAAGSPLFGTVNLSWLARQCETSVALIRDVANAAHVRPMNGCVEPGEAKAIVTKLLLRERDDARKQALGEVLRRFVLPAE
jgi:hypothetical protein